jgi:hypothetical protein
MPAMPNRNRIDMSQYNALGEEEEEESKFLKKQEAEKAAKAAENPMPKIRLNSNVAGVKNVPQELLDMINKPKIS